MKNCTKTSCTCFEVFEPQTRWSMGTFCFCKPHLFLLVVHWCFVKKKKKMFCLLSLGRKWKPLYYFWRSFHVPCHRAGSVSAWVWCGLLLFCLNLLTCMWRFELPPNGRRGSWTEAGVDECSDPPSEKHMLLVLSPSAHNTVRTRGCEVIANGRKRSRVVFEPKWIFHSCTQEFARAHDQ